MWNPLGLKLCGAVVRQREREGVEERDNMMAQQESVNRLQTLIKYCDISEQKTRAKMNQT